MLSLLVGTAMGAAAGFFGKWADAPVMRLTDLFLALPWLYLLLAVRAFLPLMGSQTQQFAMAFNEMRRAYREGAMLYGMFSARKP